MGHPNAPIGTPLPKISPALKKELAKLYQELASEQTLLSVSCNMCGHCCNFASYDHELWTTSMELAYLLECEGFKKVKTPGLCPYMENNQCTARQGRTLGCRIFLCEMDAEKMERLHEKYFEQLRALAKKYEIEIEYGEFIASLNGNG